MALLLQIAVVPQRTEAVPGPPRRVLTDPQSIPKTYPRKSAGSGVGWLLLVGLEMTVATAIVGCSRQNGLEVSGE